jgi:hypothetical protein
MLLLSDYKDYIALLIPHSLLFSLLKAKFIYKYMDYHHHNQAPNVCVVSSLNYMQISAHT